MAINKGNPEGGKGGKLGRSNMAYWGTNDEAKEDARKYRRQVDREAVSEGLKDLKAPGRTIKARKRRGRQSANAAGRRSR